MHWRHARGKIIDKGGKKEEEEEDDEEDWHSKFKKTTSRPVIIQEITADAWTLSDEEEKEDINSERNNN